MRTLLTTLAVLFAAVLPLLSLSCKRSDDTKAVIYIVSPHASDIRLEFSKAFAAWHKAKYGYEVTLKWPDHGGTADIQRYLDQEYRRRGESCGYDIFFGGGSNTFNVEADRGHLAEPPNVAEIMATFPADTELVTLSGRFKDPRKPDAPARPLWFAATMSNFGICLNRDRVRELKLPTPAEWKDLAVPEWTGQLSLADPSKSGSVLTCYEMILDQYGWEEGWRVLALMFANSDAVKDGGSNPAEEAALGNTAAGVVIDFFARNHVAKLGSSPATGPIMSFLIPRGGSSLDADPIAMLKGAPNAELAGRLIAFATSPEGQKLWVYRPRTPGGPLHKSLGRLAIRREFYTDPALAEHLFDKTDPFAESVVLKTEREARGVRRRFLGDLMKQAFVVNHEPLVKARRAVNAVRAGDPARAAALDARLSALPAYAGEPLTQARFKALLAEYVPANAADTERNQTAIRDAWKTDFAARYKAILDEARR